MRSVNRVLVGVSLAAVMAADALPALAGTSFFAPPPGMSLTQFALRWILMFDAVTCAIPGAKRPAQAEENFSAADLPPLSAETMAAVQAIYDRSIRPLVHHYW